jgi:hypothetical protein
MPRGGPGGGQINYREEEKKILDSILGRDVYDNRIRPSGANATGMKLFGVFLIRKILFKILIFFALFNSRCCHHHCCEFVHP